MSQVSSEPATSRDGTRPILCTTTDVPVFTFGNPCLELEIFIMKRLDLSLGIEMISDEPHMSIIYMLDMSGFTYEKNAAEQRRSD